MQPLKLNFDKTGIERAAHKFLESTKGYRKFAFYGEMGAGKTTFITALCKALKTSDLVSSPTFAIVNEYALSSGDQVFHFDFYRIKSSGELLDIGFYDYCDLNAYCFIEWPEKAAEIIPEDFIDVQIQVNEDETRCITIG